MVNQEYYNLGTAPSVIRQLFAYGLEQAKVVGPEKVYDYSLGNPSIPAPKKVNESIKKIVDETDSIKLHGYSMAPGFDEARTAVAKDLAARFGLDVKAMRTTSDEDGYEHLKNSLAIFRALEDKVAKYDYEYANKLIEARKFEQLEMYTMNLLMGLV